MAKYDLDLQKFQTPPEDCSLAPFWFLNGDLTDEELVFQLKEMKDKGVDECVLHARKGLTVPYLSEEWFYKIGVILKEMKSLGMRAWIYDEDNWPSGYAGGRVVKDNPEFAAKCLGVEKIYPVLGEYIKVEDKPGTEIECVIAVHSDSYFLDITDYEKKTAKPWRSETLCWEVFVFRKELCRHKPAYSGEPYVDLLNPAATAKFVKTTHAEYKKRLSEYWGSTVKGFFTDEPGFYQNYLEQCANLNCVIWTDDFAARFIKKYGYDIRPYLCCLWQDMGTRSVKTRCDYYTAVAEFYKESYFGVINEFLKKDGLLHIGHLHREDYIESLVQTESDFFSAISALDYSGIDCIEKNTDRITEKLGSSAAHVYDKNICFSETYGGFGWGLSTEEMKRRADIQYVQGINMLVPHAFFYSTDGVRKTESPPSLFIQNGYWKFFKTFSDYVKRLSYFGRCGEFRADVMFYFPVKTSWAKFRPLYRYDVHDLDREVLALSRALKEGRADFDYFDDTALSACEVRGKKIFGGENNGYSAIVIPEISVLPLACLKKISEFALSGGKIVCVKDFNPADTDGERSEEYISLIEKVKKSEGFIVLKKYREEEIVSLLGGAVGDPIVGGENGVYAMKREDGNYKYTFFINVTDSEKRFTATERGVLGATLMSAENGAVSPAAYVRRGEAVEAKITLPSYGSAIVAFNKRGDAKTAEAEKEYSSADITSGWSRVSGGKSTPCDTFTLHGADINGKSPELTYKREFVAKENTRYLVEFENVKNYVYLSVNGKFTGARLWSPYTFDITDFTTPGKNVIEFTVGGTMENEMTGSDEDYGVFGKIILKTREKN